MVDGSCRRCRFSTNLSSSIFVTCDLVALSQRFVGGFVSPICRFPQVSWLERVGTGDASDAPAGLSGLVAHAYRFACGEGRRR